MAEPTFVVGIDLGTTNSVVSYAWINQPSDTPSQIQVLEIPQTISPGVVEARQTLPSFLFSPGSHDVPAGALDLPWKKGIDFTVGEFAKSRGAEIPQRLIASSKSWLCHSLVDRNKAILPWKSPDGCPKLSPVAASSRILDHIRGAWNHLMATNERGYEDRLALEHQAVYLTVPASFDAVARELTVKAAELAGFQHVTLLEEPTAAFYAWIHDSGDGWRDSVREGDRILVCDIGGGTSDFSLIQVGQSGGALDLERIAVGNHLLVGGDNMDLTLAYSLSQKLARHTFEYPSTSDPLSQLPCRKRAAFFTARPGSCTHRHPWERQQSDRWYYPYRTLQGRYGGRHSRRVFPDMQRRRRAQVPYGGRIAGTRSFL